MQPRIQWVWARRMSPAAAPFTPRAAVPCRAMAWRGPGTWPAPFKLAALLAAATHLRPSSAIDPSDIPSFTFACWAQDSDAVGPAPPARPPAKWAPRSCNGGASPALKTADTSVSRRQKQGETASDPGSSSSEGGGATADANGSAGTTSPPLVVDDGCAAKQECVDGECCTGLIGEARPSCVNNASAYAFVLGGHPHGPRGVWYNPSTWDCVSQSSRTDWGNWSAEFTPAMASAYAGASNVGSRFPALPAQIGVRSTRLDSAVLNITCVFRFTASARASDAGKTSVVTARVQNSNCSTCPGWTGMKGDNGGGYVGLMLGRDGSGEPQVQSFASFNRERYFSKLPAESATPPSLFPVVDLFEADGDLTTSEEAFAALTQVLGVNTPTGGVAPPRWSGRRMGIPWGQADPQGAWGTGGVLGVPGEYRKSTHGKHTVPCYTANSSCTLHDYCTVNATDAELVNKTDIAGECDATFAGPVTPGTLVASPLADEPGWRAPFHVPVATSSVVRARWQAFLQARGMTPELLGALSWDGVVPVSDFPQNTPTLDLPTRRRFYWSVRFIHWDSCRYMADWTAGLQAASKDPAFPAYVNWNNFDGRMYVPGHGPFPATDNVTAQLSYDWFEWARERGGSVLWTEDWMAGHATPRWSYYASRLRSAAALGDAAASKRAAESSAPPPPPIEFSGYIVAGTAASGGAMPGALLLRPLTLVGSGSKLVRYYNFGPEYMFPANSYSDSPNVTLLLAELAKANGMIAAAEHVLWPARRPRAQVAILQPRSSTMWDQWHFANGSRGYDGLCMCCCTSSMVEKYVDYSAEVYGLYLALAIDSNIPVDFVDEDALQETETLAAYKLVFVTQPNVPAAGAAGLAAWVRAGGTLVTVSGAGSANEYDSPLDTLSDLAGVCESPRPRIALESATDMSIGQPKQSWVEKNGTARMTPGGDALRFTAQGAAGTLTPAGPNAKQVKHLATFDDGTPAVTVAASGKGGAVHFAWLPGLAYWFGQECTSVPPTGKCSPLGKPARNESVRRVITALPSMAGVVAPATASQLGVETPLMLTPQQDKAVVTLLNFQATVCDPVNATVPNCHTPTVPRLALNVTLPFRPANVTSVERGSRAFDVAMLPGGSGWAVSLELPLDHGDFVLFE